jgi:hypothetical protein
MARSKYQERVKSIAWEMQEEDEERQRQIFKWWCESIKILKNIGRTTKTLVEDFLFNNRPCQTVSEVELQLLKRALDHLAALYNQ